MGEKSQNKRWATTIKTISLASLATTVMLQGVLASLPATAVFAQEEDQNQQAETTAQNNDQSYDFVARSSNNLSLLVRRAIQLHTAESDELSNPQAIYVETLVVREMGASHINVGQRVSVPADLVARYVASARELSEAQVAAWGRYAANANFNISHIQPATQPGGESDEEPAADNGNDADEETEVDPETATDEETDEDEAANEENGTEWWWFLILAAAVAGLWYTVRRSDNTGSSTKATSNTKTTVRKNSKSAKKKK